MVPRVITKRLLIPKEAAGYLEVSERALEYLHLKRIIHQTRLPATKKRVYDVVDLDELVDGIKAKRVLNTS